MRRLNVLVACEFSGVVRRAFRERGHRAYSCDLLPADDGDAYHFQCDVFEVLNNKYSGKGWDLMIAHPPCTFLCNSGVRWLYGGKGKVRDETRWSAMSAGARFFRDLLLAGVPRICVENPIMHKYAREYVGRGPDQYIQPWQFGHGETKNTGLWLVGLPLLKPTKIVSGRTNRIHFASPGPDRWRERSITYTGIAAAMADQWGDK